MTTRPTRHTAVFLLTTWCLGMSACDDAGSLEYEVTVEPTSISVQIGAEHEQPVTVRSTNQAADAIDETLSIISSAPDVVTFGSFTAERGFNDISQVDGSLYYIPLDSNRASMTVTCLAPGDASIRLKGELNGSIADYESVAEFAVSCHGPRSDLVVTIDSITDSSLAYVDMNDMLVVGKATIHFTVTNIGEADAGTFSVSAWADLDTPPIPGEGINTLEFPGLAVGESVSGTVEDTNVEAQTQTSAWAYVDPTQSLAESNEANNVSAPYPWP